MKKDLEVIELKKCPVCDSENWQSLNYLRDKKFWEENGTIYDYPFNFKICMSCGFVTYDYLTEEILKKKYEMQRQKITIMNIVTGNRKNEYHKAFLKDLLKELYYKKRNIKIIDIGSAQGQFLDWIARDINVPREQLYATEYCKKLRAFTKYHYNLNTAEKIEDFGNQKYDFISYYHTLEHIQYPDEELLKIRDYLVDDGYLYISIPVFFDILDETSGQQTLNFEELYHPNHINCWNKENFEIFIKKCGFKIIKKDEYDMYGYTVLLQKDNFKKQDIKNLKQKPVDIIKILNQQREAIELVSNNLYNIPADQHISNIEKAIKVYPKYPDAYLLLIQFRENMKDFEKSRQILEDALKVMPNYYKILYRLGLLYMQWDNINPQQLETEYITKNIQKAKSIFEKLLITKPGDENLYDFLAIIEGYYYHNYDKAIEYLKKALEINPTLISTQTEKLSYFYNKINNK